MSKPQLRPGFAARVVQWQVRHGRNNLPWQTPGDPYRVWLSEIMLQQTQVATVKRYFERFVAAFPDVASLAAADEDTVLGLWSGLGYYSRARNLHRCARAVMSLHGGAFPRDARTLETLPGIGRSTAAAIASVCFAERVPILDANVKRVLARVQAFDADLAVAGNARVLWEMAAALLPPEADAATMPAYTQGMMDLGATLCKPKEPLCSQCPVQQDCAAYRSGDPARYPVRSRKLKRSSQSLWLLWAQSPSGAVWLSKRPVPGVWGGLYCLPLFESEDALRQCLIPKAACQLQSVPAITHVLTHKDLHLHPCRVLLGDGAPNTAGRWVASTEWESLGLPAPIRKLLAS